LHGGGRGGHPDLNTMQGSQGHFHRDCVKFANSYSCMLSKSKPFSILTLNFADLKISMSKNWAKHGWFWMCLNLSYRVFFNICFKIFLFVQ
jgi:hypothetical protein